MRASTDNLRPVVGMCLVFKIILCVSAYLPTYLCPYAPTHVKKW